MQLSLQNVPLGWVQAFAGLVALATSVLVWKRRKLAPGVMWLAFSFWASAFWCFTAAFDLWFLDLQAKTFASQLSYLGITTTPFFYWRFAMAYSGREARLTKVFSWLFIGLLLLVNSLVFTNAWHHQFWSEVRGVDIGGFLQARYERGPWFWTNMVYCYALSFWTAVIMCGHALNAQRSAWIQNALLVASIACPLLFSLFYILRVPLVGDVDNTPIGFVASGLLLTINMLLYQLFRSVPLVGSLLLQRMRDPVLVVDLQRHLVLASPAAAARFGLQLRDFEALPIEAFAKKLPELHQALLRGESENLVSFRQGEAYWDMQSSTITERNGTARGRMHVFREVTQLHEALRAADENASRARRANEAKSLFMAQVSHDLRTPMHAILGTLDLIDTQTLTDEGRENVDTIRQASESLLLLVNGLLDISRIEAGQMKQNKRSFRLKEVLDPVLLLLRVIAARKGLYLAQNIAPEADGALYGDPELLKQILFNLIGNGIKFTEQGGVTLLASALEGSLCLQVMDTGPGIPEDRLGSIFDAFDRGDPAFASRHEGTGLGLAIAHKLTKALGGDISVTSTQGTGSCFRLELPLLNLAASDASRPGPGSRTAGKPLRVLLAEDDVLSARVSAAQITRCGCEVDIVSNGNTALERARSGSYELIVLDGNMPGLDGWEVCRRLQASPSTPHRPSVLALSADVSLEALARWKNAGADEVLPKPLPNDRLARSLESFAHQSPS